MSHEKPAPGCVRSLGNHPTTFIVVVVVVVVSIISITIILLLLLFGYTHGYKAKRVYVCRLRFVL